MQTAHSETAAATSASCTSPSPVVFLFVTLLVTIGATAMLCAAIMTDHWEYVSWDEQILENLTKNTTNTLQWHLNGKVAAINVKYHGRKENIFLVPMHGGIWTLCIDISEHEMRILGRSGFPHTQKCVNYLDDTVYTQRGEELWRNTGFPNTYHPQLRMQNLSISCSLVCLIILGSAALVGAFGVCQRQISAILVTGVMYLLAALFSFFTLMIIYVKRHQSRPLTDADFEGTIEGLVAARSASGAVRDLLQARVFTKSWSLDLGWCGVLCCSFTSALWIYLSKKLRYNPFSSVLS